MHVGEYEMVFEVQFMSEENMKSQTCYKENIKAESVCVIEMKLKNLSSMNVSH